MINLLSPNLKEMTMNTVIAISTIQALLVNKNIITEEEYKECYEVLEKVIYKLRSDMMCDMLNKYLEELDKPKNRKFKVFKNIFKRKEK